MFLFLRRRLIRYLAVAVLLPLIGALAIKASNELEQRRGKTISSRALRKAGQVLNRKPSTA
ncbi:MAG: hypothetical protein M3083_11710 [Actinomycetota bacterium]|nr:hypothetical protein [Actinomycetota bacterium]MDQ6946243.1 hypothetical protein [Actinomycetota bacterium]